MADDFTMDCKPEERLAQTIFSSVFEVDDLNGNYSTLTAPETHVNHRELIPTPPLLCKLKKCRVRIKRLPRHILAKYNNNNKNTTTNGPGSVVTKRTSKRLDGRTLPGKYLALHFNKPLNEVLNKKTKLDTQFKLQSEIDYLGNKTGLGVLDFSKNISNDNSSFVKKGSFTWSPTSSWKPTSYLASPQLLQKEKEILKIASAEEKQLKERNNSFLSLSTVNKYTDLVITKYAMPNSSSTNLSESTRHKTLSFTNDHIPKESPATSVPSNVINQCVISKFNARNNTISRPCGNNNTSQKLISMFHKENTSASLNNEHSKHLSEKNSLPMLNCIPNNAVIVDPPKVLVINQPAQKK